jgi:hypothetical protein
LKDVGITIEIMPFVLPEDNFDYSKFYGVDIKIKKKLLIADWHHHNLI